MNAHAGLTTSLWVATATVPQFPSLKENAQADVCIVGAGIAGLTTAYFLTRAGRTVVVLDDGPILSGETERTTAHLANALDDRFTELERWHGRDGARLAAESHGVAIDTIERLVRELRIDCDFARVDGYLFNGPQAQPHLLESELAAAQRVGFTAASFVQRAPLPSFNTGRALRFPRQAQFHPLKYLAALALAIVDAGGRIFAGTHVAEVHGGRRARVRTDDGRVVDCGAVVVATNTPVNDRVVIHTKQAAYRTYVIGAAIPPGAVPAALYWDTEEPYHYVRVQPAGDDGGNEVLIVGGEDHKTGQADDAEARYGRLESWMRARFPEAGAIRFRWSGQVMEPVDGLAFIGRNPLDAENVYVATGDSGHGMTHGTIAGLLLTDLIVGRESPWAELYDPSRISPGAVKNYTVENANTAAQYGDWLTAGEAEKAKFVPPGAGAVVRHGLTKVAVCRDADGMFHECSAVCPHLGGIVHWNPAERTWDCPAHGSRFDCRGNVLNGPANRGLAVASGPAK